jgi:hypothetical protein
MATHGFAPLERDDREFLLILGACGLGYALLAVALSFVPTPTRSATDVASLPPRIARLILEAPPTPTTARIAPPTASLETPAAREAKPTPDRVAKKPETPVPPQAPPPSEEQIRADAEAALTEARLRLEAETAARREQNRTVAKQSGLLKALSAGGGGAGVGDRAALDRVLSDVSVLSNPSLAPTGAGGGTGDLGEGSGSGGGRLSVDDVVSGLKGQGSGEAVILAGKAASHVDSALVVKGASPTRSDESIRKVLKGLDAWLKFKYHKAQRDRPGLGVSLAVEFTITPQGDVVNCRVASSTLGYPPLEETITKRFCLLTFPPLDEGADDEVTTKYLIDFEGFH